MSKKKKLLSCVGIVVVMCGFTRIFPELSELLLLLAVVINVSLMQIGK